MIVEFGEWLPDWRDQANPNQPFPLRLAKNVIPTQGGYRRLPAYTIYAPLALPRQCLGAGMFPDVSTVQVVAGDTDALYINYANQTFTVAAVSATLSLSTTTFHPWEFVQYKNTVIAVCSNNWPRAWTIGAALSFDVLTTQIRPNHAVAAREFLITSGSKAGGVYERKAVKWSGFGTPANYTVGVNQSDEQILDEGGDIVQLFGGDYVTVMQRQAIRRMTYVGTPVVWQIDRIEGARGQMVDRAAVQVGGVTYYISDDGFYAFDGVQSVPIGNNKINDFFLNDSEHGLDYADNHLITAAASNVQPLIYFGYPSTSHPGMCDRILIYNYHDNRWSLVDAQTVQILFTPIRNNYLLDSYRDIAAFNGSNRWGFMSSNTAHYTAIIETVDYQAVSGRRSVMKNIRPLVDGFTAQPQIAVATRENTGETVSFSALMTAATSGYVRPRATGRYHRVRMQIADNFDLIYGMDVEHTPRGRR